MDAIAGFFGTAVFVFFACLIGEPIIRSLLRMFGVYAVVEEGTCHVYVLFGKVIATLKEPGLNFLWMHLGDRKSVV